MDAAGGGQGGVDENFLGIEAVCSLIECNEAMCEVSPIVLEMKCDGGFFAGDRC